MGGSVQPESYDRQVAERVVVFLDWQNVYRRARGAFFSDAHPNTDGQVNPVSLAHRLVSRKPDRVLKEVHVYRGIPTNEKNAEGYAATRRQTAAWGALNPRPHVYMRPLQYMPGFDPREKGIDVQLAIDFTVMAVLDEYEVGILFSTDTDLKPALDAVCLLHGRGGRATAEVAAWRGPNTMPRRIAPTGSHRVWCHWLEETDYRAVNDATDYNAPT